MKSLENQNVILVGNSVEILLYEHGKWIDSFDKVIRMGRGLPTKDNSKAIGTRTDVWVTGFLREGWVKSVPDAEVLLNRCRMHLTTPREWDIEGTEMFTDKELLKIYKEFDYQDDSSIGRPSNGFVTILYLIQKAWIWKSLTLIGFDFFAKSLPFKVGEAEPHSWHLPHNRVNETPHKADTERAYALDLYETGVIDWKILSDLKVENVEF